jgi:hypothetical protein
MNRDDIDPDTIAERDLYDPDLTRALRALAPVNDEEGDAYAQALPHFARARRRHRTTTAVLAVAASVLIVGGISLATGSPGLSGVHTTNSPAHQGGPTRKTNPGPTADTQPRSDTTTLGGGNVAPPNVGTPSTSSTSATTTAGGAGGTHRQTFSSAGGSIVVRFGDRSVSLVSEQPGPGYTADVRSSGPTEVEVRFRTGSSGGTEHRIRLRFASDGSLIQEIT